ncbi:unnamed protein product (macronuclear) [Paramecium tetraurelia]|uniref:Uncharacterized protein n=1 Tax=Paramecium tetraurelia TaxID=5888 RepID=A0DNE2_PARTE|nr:uncharacterized protein GSPATT00018755001 [Paramecium tetraurelia]CAK84559.1 unnamed protein product [Paramecium tetraurelia]|eukprot:XP_001451956.1 hypothetical protein (macronuclear) [Paramecium tetraurelia strain d4-2]
MNQVLESQKLKNQMSLQTSNKQLIGPLLYNLNKHTSYVFAATLHNVVLEESFEKCHEINEQKDHNLDENQWQEVKRQLWQSKIERQGGQSSKQQKCFLVSAGADKNIYLWDIDAMQLSSSSSVQIKPEQLPQYPNAQENQGNENQHNLNFSKDELDLRHVIIPYQQNLYEFITCLLNVELNQNQTYLIVGYESNQIIRYQISGKYWMKGIKKQIRYILNLSEVLQITKKLHSHNDAVRSMVYFNNQLCSCGDDMQLLIQTIDGKVIKRFYFDSIIENLCIWNGHLVFSHYTVNLRSTSQMKEEIVLIQGRLLIPDQNEQNQNNANQQAAAGLKVQVDKHSYAYGLQQCLMIMGENQQNNLNIQLNVLNYHPSLEDAYNQVDKITCFEVSDNQNILFSTESGKLIKIKEPLKNESNLEIKVDQYKDEENSNQQYQYRILSQFQSRSKIQEHNLNQIIMSFIRYENMIYVFYKNQNQKEQVFLQIGEEITDSNNKFYQVVENTPLRIQYLSIKSDQIDENIIRPYEVFLQNPLLIKEGNTNIILLCGDQLRYYKL